MTELSDEIIRYIERNKVPNGVNVTFTEKQRFNGIWLDGVRSERNFRHFRNLLNTRIFGNGYRRFGKQLRMLVIREVSKDGRHHLHTVIEHPSRMEFVEFSLLIEEVWNRCDFGFHQIHIEKPTSALREVGWIDYITKSRSKNDFEFAIDWMNSTTFNLC